MRENGGGRTGMVVETIRSRLAAGTLGAGDRLPSIRRLAVSLQVSASTVVEAYDRLAAEGLIRARRGSGFYVVEAALPPLALNEAAPRRERDVDPLWVSRQSLDADGAVLMPGCGWLPASWMPHEALRRALRALARGATPALTDYGSTRGSPALRRQLAVRLAGCGVETSPTQWLLTASATQALDLVCRDLLRPGDTVLVDDPCYFNFLALLRAHRATVVSVPRTPRGPDIEHFEAIVQARRPRLYLTNSGLHNPTGATLAPAVAHRLLTAAAAQRMSIVEDDIFGDFEPEPSPRLAALDGLEQVIVLGSFSKTLSASLRCGYVAAAPARIERLLDLQVATGFGGPGAMAAEALAHVLASGAYRRHTEALRGRLAQARGRVARRLRQVGIEPWLMPRGGFHLWCRLPDGCDAVDVARAAWQEQVVLAPGNVFSPARMASGMMRFNVAHSDDARLPLLLERALERAAVASDG